MTTIRAHFDGKAFVPDEPVDVPVNQQVTIIVIQPPPERPPMTVEEFERLWAEIDQDAVAVDHEIDFSRESMY